jgi:DNA-binding NtrC family response regulator
MRSLEDDLRLASGPQGLVGKNVRMLEIYQLIDQLADNDVSVLITGESGTGKEVVASAIHARSHRRERPFVRVNCAALSETLLESELFGHVRGAFTGAIRDRKGRFEAAHRGTIFLDEVGAVSLEVQKRLLRVLQERQFERVGEEHTQEVDVRVIAATNADLKAMVVEGSFREDLYYRLNVVHLHIPALRERREDIPSLAEHLLKRHADSMGRGRMSFDAEALSLLMASRWEGNVRQLENAVQRALVVSRGRVIRPQHLPPEILKAAGASPAGGVPRDPNALSASQAELLRALAEADGNLGRAARKLGIHRTTLWRRLKKHGLRHR